ncbi:MULTISPECIES: ABC transporter substrate-binding protein [Clostridium]|uniref:ABC transporter substrate-binding protein n=1 Tax=Clostridium cibarium TaxID=2762247 RepID=A0ABR8PVM3_9CLOT|nr:MULTISPECIES: ABC transporter substrate-binding protein [Clostridium]MBD7912214.1 ABC transporter substrate-binding protein [Clostridium cibarium]
MKKKSKLSLFLAFVFTLSSLFVSCSKKSDSNLIKVRLCEVVRSVFYAPMYVALNEGFFKDEGLDIDLTTGQGADKVMQNVLSNNADIGFCGPEQVVYINNQGRENYPIIFAELTKKDGSFLVSKKTESNFTWESLKGKKIIGGRPGGVPEMALEYVMKKHGIDPKTDVQMVTNIDFTATAGAFKSGSADYVALFEPTASMLESEGGGSIVSSIGESTGNVAYTCFFSTKSYMNKNTETLDKFTRAIYKGQKWVQTHSSDQIASSIESYFPGTDKDIIIKVINNYKNIDAFSADPKLKEEDLSKLMEVIQSYDSSLIPSRPAYEKIVNSSFAENVIN